VRASDPQPDAREGQAGPPEGGGEARSTVEAVLVLEPIFEADLEPEQHAYRPERNALEFDPRTGQCYLGTRPSRKKIERLCREISELTGRNTTRLAVDEQVGRINRKLRGWSNYFCIGTISKAYRTVNEHVRHRVGQWLGAKFGVRGRGKIRFSNGYLHGKLQLHQLFFRRKMN
jgi:hypothetical protein